MSVEAGAYGRRMSACAEGAYSACVGRGAECLSRPFRGRMMSPSARQVSQRHLGVGSTASPSHSPAFGFCVFVTRALALFPTLTLSPSHTHSLSLYILLYPSLSLTLGRCRIGISAGVVAQIPREIDRKIERVREREREIEREREREEE